MPRPALGSAQPPVQWVVGAFSLGIKQPECEANHSSPSSAKVKKCWSHTTTPPNAFMAFTVISLQSLVMALNK
jgi:hypothetical protein